MSHNHSGGDGLPVCHGCFLSISFSISSREILLVSGKSHQTTTTCTIIISAKKVKGAPAWGCPTSLANLGKAHDIIIAMNQCVELPSVCPLARTAFGKTSLI